MAFRDRQAEIEAAAADGCDRLARHDHGILGDRNGQDLAVGGRKNGAFLALFHDDRTLGLCRRDLVAYHIDLRAQGIQTLRRRDAALDQFLAAGEFRLGVFQRGAQTEKLRFDCRDLEIDLVVLDHGNDVACLDVDAFGDLQLHDCPPDASARGDRVARLDAAIDGLPFGDLDRLETECLGREGGCR